MLSTAEQKKFYYNQDTGETRWENACVSQFGADNWANYLAEIECAVPLH
jgi:hypothetical protein